MNKKPKIRVLEKIIVSKYKQFINLPLLHLKAFDTPNICSYFVSLHYPGFSKRDSGDILRKNVSNGIFLCIMRHFA